MKEFISDESGSLPKGTTTEGEVGKVGKKGIISGIIDWAGRHPKLSTLLLLGAFSGAVGVNEYANNKKIADQVIRNSFQ